MRIGKDIDIFGIEGLLSLWNSYKIVYNWMDLGLIYVWYFYKYYFVWLKGDSNLKFKKNFNCFGNIKIIIEYLRVFVNFNYIFII